MQIRIKRPRIALSDRDKTMLLVGMALAGTVIALSYNMGNGVVGKIHGITAERTYVIDKECMEIFKEGGWLEIRYKD